MTKYQITILQTVDICDLVLRICLEIRA